MKVSMKYNLVEINRDQWQEIVNNSPIATFYHTPAWSDILCMTFPRWENASLYFEFEDGNRAIIPMLRRPILGGFHSYWYESMTPGAYGGPIFKFSPSSVHYESIEAYLAGYENLLIVGNPYSNWHPDANFNTYETFIQILHLSTDFEKNWRKYSKGRRHTINYAKKQGVIVEEIDFYSKYQTYYEIYQRQLKRWGQKATDYYPLRLFENLAVLAQKNSQVKLWVAKLNNKIISGLVVFYHQKHLVTWHGATLDEYFEYRPVDILYSKVIEHACASGLEIFDFAYSGGHQSVVEYKERFGAEKLPLLIGRRRNIGGRIYRLGRQIKNFFGKCPED